MSSVIEPLQPRAVQPAQNGKVCKGASVTCWWRGHESPLSSSAEGGVMMTLGLEMRNKHPVLESHPALRLKPWLYTYMLCDFGLVLPLSEPQLPICQIQVMNPPSDGKKCKGSTPLPDAIGLPHQHLAKILAAIPSCYKVTWALSQSS